MLSAAAVCESLRCEGHTHGPSDNGESQPDNVLTNDASSLYYARVDTVHSRPDVQALLSQSADLELLRR